MPDDPKSRESRAPAAPRPGQLSALLQDLVRAPQDERGEGWAQALEPGAVINRFELLREIGRGGFGVVWEAKDRELGRIVAFKALQAVTRRDVAEERLLREAESAARLSHPNIVTLFDVGRSEHGPYLVLELLRGRTLADRLELGRMSVREALHVTSEVAKGVAHAHASGVVHRDLKPANVFLCDDGQVKVLDFGMAHAFGHRRQDGGTPAYMAPEQWESAPEDERTDVFAMGVLLYRLLAGELPFPDDAGRSVQGLGPAPALDVPELPGLGDLVARMLEKRAVLRPRDGGEVVSALRTLQLELERSPASGAIPVTTRPRTGLPGLVSELKRRRVVPAMVGYGTFALVALRVVDWLVQSGRVPRWTAAFSFALLGLGLPLALFLAWRYDLTGQGIRRTPSTTAGSSSALGSRRARVALVLTIVGVGAAVPGLIYWFAFSNAAAGRPATADERVVVAVADFANETGERELDSLSGLLITSLEQSRALSILPRGRLFDLAREAGHATVTRIDERVGRDAGRKGGVRALLVATIHRLGGTYAVELRALDPNTDAYLFTMKEAVQQKDALFGLLDRLAERTRTELHDGSGQAQVSSKGAARAVTTSLEAYEYYFRGQAYDDRADYEKAAAEYRKAIEKDPEFAVAHYALSVVLRPLGGSQQERRSHAAAALRRPAELPEKERLLALAWQARSLWKFDEARMHYRLLVERYPHDKRSLVLAADTELNTAFDAEAARVLAERAVKLDPSFQPANDLFRIALLNLGRMDEAVVFARAWARDDPSDMAQVALYECLAMSGRADEAQRVVEAPAASERNGSRSVLLWYRRMEAHVLKDELGAAAALLGPERGQPIIGETMFRSELALYRGRPREAARILERGETRGARKFELLYPRVMNLASEGPSPALREATRELRAHSEHMDSSVVTVLAVAGELDLAEEVARSSDAASIDMVMIEAMRARAAGDLAGARRKLEPLSQAAPLFRRHVASFALGETCQLAGDDRCAVEALRQVRWLFDPVWGNGARWLYPRSLMLMARSYERLGDRTQALETVDRLLTLWKDAEPDFAPLAEARAFRSKLQGSKAMTAAPSARPLATVPAASVAVLPFADMSAGKDQEYFADGVAEEILSALSRVDGLRVIGRTSSFSFKGKNEDVRDIGRKLNVATVLEGSFRRSGHRVRIATKLVRADDGATMWSETFDRDDADLFATQDDIARGVTAALRLKLLGDRLEAATPRTDVPEAHAELLRGRALVRKGTLDAHRLGIQAFERAIAMDPRYAPAYSELALALRVLFVNYDEGNPADVTRAKAMVERALALGPKLAEAYGVRAILRMSFDWDWDGARADLDRAMALAPRDVRTRVSYAFLLETLGRLAQAIDVIRSVVRDDPRSAEALALLGYYQLALGEVADGRRALNQALELEPQRSFALGWLASVELHDGNPVAALAISGRMSNEPFRRTLAGYAHHDLGHTREVSEVIAWFEHRFENGIQNSAYDLATLHAHRGERDLAFAWLERARALRDPDLRTVKCFYFLRNIRTDPRFRELLRKVNLPED